MYLVAMHSSQSNRIIHQIRRAYQDHRGSAKLNHLSIMQEVPRTIPHDLGSTRPSCASKKASQNNIVRVRLHVEVYADVILR